VSVSGCGDRPPGPGEVTVALPSDPQSLDPRFGSDANAARVADLLHAGLTRADAAARRVPDLARAWETPDPRTLVFHLRPDARFADGTPVTARDVQATYDAVRDPALASPRRAALAPLATVEAPDATTVVMRLREPSPPFLDATGLGILPAARARDAGDVTVGAGPFRLVEAVRGDRLVLKPSRWRDGGEPRLRRLVIRIVPDEVIRALDLVRGGLDLLPDNPEPEIVAWLARHPGVRVRQRPGTSFAYLAVNHRDPRLRDRRVRAALALAIDRAGLVRHVLGGAARPATSLLAPEHWAYARVPAWRHDPARARRLLDRAGFRDPDGPGPAPRFTLVYKTSTQPSRRRLAEAVQADLAAVGIRLDIRSYEWGTLYADVRRGRFQLCALAWVGVGDPDLYRLALHSRMEPPAGYNRGGYRDPVMDRLTAAAAVAPDPVRRAALYARIQRREAARLPWIPLWWEDRVVVERRRLRGFVPTPAGDLRGLAVAWTD
jgi:peptide/nickel transport system substrate-binding protein